MKLFECAFLVELPISDAPSLIAMYPIEHKLSNEMQSLSASCCPSAELPQDPCLFTFNVPSCYCYTLYFSDGGLGYDIIICSIAPFAYFFLKFLGQVLEEFKNADINPRMRFAYVQSLLESWQTEVTLPMTLSFPNGNLEWIFSEQHFSYKHFEPTKFFTKQQILQIWHALFVGDPILFIASNANIASRACFAAFSLLSPMQYKDKCALWLRETDPRFIDIISDETDLKVVATPNKAVAESKTNYFKTIIYVPDQRYIPDNDFIDKIRVKTEVTLQITLTEMDEIVVSDPWADIIDTPLNLQRLKHLVKLSDEVLPAEDIIKFSQSDTFRLWRRRTARRESWRNGILSVSPRDALIGKSIEQLNTIKEKIPIMEESYGSDEHVKSVLKKHKKIIQELLNQEQS